MNHRERGLTHSEQTHLGKIVEIIFVENRVARLMEIERLRPLIFGFGQHCIEQRDFITMLAQGARGVQRPQRGIGLHRRPEFGIEAQKVGLAEEDLGHNVINSLPASHTLNANTANRRMGRIFRFFIREIRSFALFVLKTM